MIRLAWKNIIANPLASLLSIGLVALSSALIIVFSRVDQAFEATLNNNTAGVHLILAAKGSPLQAVLCNLFHVDNPTGNIKVDEVKAFLRPGHPLIQDAIPLSIGDSYRSHRIVGTVRKIAEFYSLELHQGRYWASSGEVVVGAAVAENTGLKIGDSFKSSHGLVEDGLDHTHDHPLFVTGIMKSNGSVMDNLILTSYETMWAVHGGGDHHHEEGEDHQHAEKRQPVEVAQVDSERQAEMDEAELLHLLDHGTDEITSVLLSFRNHNHQTLNMMRSINANATFQAAHPAWELNRLFSLVGVGTKMLSWLALIIGAVSMLSIFLALLQALKSRRYELAILRVMGSGRPQVFRMIIWESLIQVGLGLLIGLILSSISLVIIRSIVQASYGYYFDWWPPGLIEARVVGIALLLGILAALWPAWQAYRTDVSRVLQSGQ